MEFNVNIKQKISAWPKKIPSMKDMHRTRFPKLPLQTTSSRQISRPQPRQQARSKEQLHFDHPQTQMHSQYLTLESLSKIFHLFRTHRKSHEHSDTATDLSTSTTTSAKYRGHEHLQRTATRWWKSNRILDSPLPSITNHQEEILPTIQNYPKEHFPLLTVVSNSTRQINPYDDQSDIPDDKPVRPLFPTLNYQEPLIMQARGMRFQSSNHRFYPNEKKMNFFQQQRLIHQT